MLALVVSDDENHEVLKAVVSHGREPFMRNELPRMLKG